MKSDSALLKNIRSKKRLECAWKAIQENARTSTSDEVRREADLFAENATPNINSLSGRLASGSFSFGQARGIPAHKKGIDGKKIGDKTRPLVLAPLESRIVQRAILETLISVQKLKPYAENPYSFGGIRKAGDGLAAVPAAVNSVLQAIGDGGTYVAFADIRSFFTRISKTEVSAIVALAVNDPEFMAFFNQAIAVELANLAELKEKAKDFPTFDIGVAQGNCLSPLLGNLILHDFDRQMNEGDCRCYRYIDDFIVVAPNIRAAKARMIKAEQILKKLGMELSPEKSSKEPFPVTEAFIFLGVEFCNGLIRPANKAKAKILENIAGRFKKSIHAMNTFKSEKGLDRKQSLTATLRRVDGIVNGWGKHFRFCNDEQFFNVMDADIKNLVSEYLGKYRKVRDSRSAADAPMLLGMQQLSRIERKPLVWPKKRLGKIAR
ncbi:MAG: reverse transcriptase domain-containing protein [Methylovirgula sp.]